MTPDDTSNSANLTDSEKFLNFTFAYSFLGMLFLFCGCLSLWLVTLMFQSVMSDDQPVPKAEVVESAPPGCSDQRIKALQDAVAACVEDHSSDAEATCIEVAQRALCAVPKPKVVPGAGIHARDRRSAEGARRERDTYVREMIRRQYTEGQVSRALDRYDETYGSVPFFQREKRWPALDPIQGNDR